MNSCTPHRTLHDVLFRCRHGHKGNVVLSMNSPSPIMHKLINSFTLAIFMVLVLQRRVLVMGPRIILRDAIPIDSNIGGSGHRPLLREARARSVSCVCFCLSGFWSIVCVCAAWLVFSFSCPCFRFFSVSHGFRSSVVAEAVLPLVASGTTAPSGTTALQRGTTAVRRGQGVISGAGGVSSPPYPFARPLALSSLQQPAPREGPGGSPSPGRFSPFPSVETIPTLSSCHGCRYCPRSLSLLV